ncbi:cytochrome b/b6 domain-containing protein [Ideonella sp. YS5]|uniref:cytochrome b/b6 domain-containing protein n=1 Tax=Ideonella sp. YS5 TaxID=3453714 RepID=UPI003EED3810
MQAEATAQALTEAITHETPRPTRRVRLWDLPVRVVHWSLVLTVTAAVVTGELGGPWMVWHGRAGLLIVGLVVFRLVWGLIGSEPARFTHFAPTPGRLRAYLAGRWHGLGHNPLGALSVFALLGLLAVQAVTGLLGNDDIAFAGPLNALVDEALGQRLTGWHRLLANGLLALIALHVLAIVFYLVVKRSNLVRPMLTGWKDVHAAPPSPPPARGGSPLALLVAVAIALGAMIAASGVWQAADTAPQASGVQAW